MSQNDGRFIYTKREDNTFRVGTNPPDDVYSYGNGAVEGKNIKGTVTIPDQFQGIPVKEVSIYAFTQCINIEHIIIGKNVEIIGKYAFGDLPNVKTIYISSSVKIIKESGIIFWDSENDLSLGKVQIYIEANSKLETIENALGWKEEVHIFSPSIVTPQCSGYMFNSAKKVILFSPYEFRFCNIKSFIMKSFDTSLIDISTLFIYCSILFVINK